MDGTPVSRDWTRPTKPVLSAESGRSGGINLKDEHVALGELRERLRLDLLHARAVRQSEPGTLHGVGRGPQLTSTGGGWVAVREPPEPSLGRQLGAPGTTRHGRTAPRHGGSREREQEGKGGRPATRCPGLMPGE